MSEESFLEMIELEIQTPEQIRLREGRALLDGDNTLRPSGITRSTGTVAATLTEDQFWVQAAKLLRPPQR